MAIAAAASSSGAAMSASQVQAYQDLVPLATAQISLAVIVTALLCPVAVIIVDRWQRKQGIDGRLEDDEMDELDADNNNKEAS